MFCFSTIHVSMGFARLIDGFIYLRDKPGGPAAFFSDVSIPANVAKVIIHTVNSILGDGIVVSFALFHFKYFDDNTQVWRCYHVWGRSWWICIVPILLIIASAGKPLDFLSSLANHLIHDNSLRVRPRCYFCAGKDDP